jgi:hypothetical protein
MASEAAKVVVPESVLRKRKREDLWAVEKKEKAVAEKKKAGENRKVIFARAKQYAEEYDAQVRSLDPVPLSSCSWRWSSYGLALCGSKPDYMLGLWNVVSILSVSCLRSV